MHIIETYLKKHNLTQREFAESIGVTESYITHIKKGRRVPSVSVAIRIAEKTSGEISAVRLLGLDN